uniref:DUF148 domain-containing protein n=1 Tax=Acrobeloides nanus TaxID=290746 RepID=A0A914DF12_9BILA
MQLVVFLIFILPIVHGYFIQDSLAQTYPNVVRYSPYAYSQDSEDFQVSNYVSKRVETILESAYSYSLLSPQEQSELLTIVRNPYLSRQVLFQQMELFGAKLDSNKRYYYDKWINRLQEIFTEFASYAQTQVAQCSMQNQEYCSEFIHFITDHNLSLSQAEQKILEHMRTVPVNVKIELERLALLLDQWLLQRLKERRMIYGEPLASVVYSPEFGSQRRYAMSVDSSNNVYRPSYLPSGPRLQYGVV